jgi:WD40 repeat protein
MDGEIRVGSVFGGSEPHLLLGHEGVANLTAVSPDGKWVASYFAEGTVRLWPLPDLTKPPLHTLPYKELMAKLKALTNLRVLPDEESHTGYTFEPDFTAYRGWAEVPEW